jgi:hypothetical protein
MVNTEKEKIMSELMTKLLARLAKIFPKQDCQTRLEQFIASRAPKNAADVEHLEREYHYQQQRSMV